MSIDAPTLYLEWVKYYQIIRRHTTPEGYKEQLALIRWIWARFTNKTFQGAFCQNCGMLCGCSLDPLKSLKEDNSLWNKAQLLVAKYVPNALFSRRKNLTDDILDAVNEHLANVRG